MSRYNIFYPVHQGLKAFLYETALLLQQTDFNAGKEDLTQLKLLLEVFEQHAQTQEAFIFSSIRQRDPSQVRIFEQEHAVEKGLNQAVRNLMKTLDHTEKEKRSDIGKTINEAFVKFMIFSLRHMSGEEENINRLLWNYWTDEELQGMRVKIITSVSRHQISEYNKWIIRGLSNTEIIRWLKDIKNSMPGLIFHSVLDAAEAELSVPRWLAVQEAITEGIMINH